MEKVWLDNEKLVYSIAHRYKGRGLEFDDLVQYGALGLFTAANNFRDDLGVKLSTYAYKFIEYSILEALGNKRHIRIPKQRKTDLNAIKRVLNEGPHITLQDVSNKTGLTIDKIKDILSDPQTILLNGEEEKEMIDAIKDNSLNPHELWLKDEKEQGLINLCKRVLTEREFDGVMLRFGFITGQEVTYREIGEQLGITEEGARRLIKRSIKKLQEHEDEVRQYA